jgi:hypothetical protein
VDRIPRRRRGQCGLPQLLFQLHCSLPWQAPAHWVFLDLDGSFGVVGGHQRYVPAVSNPLFSETPYITTELRPLYLPNEIPTGFVMQGGHIDAGAVEARIALTDRLGFIAPKDGNAHLHFNEALKDTTGFENIALGLKYAVWSEPAAGEILTLGGLYERRSVTCAPAG